LIFSVRRMADMVRKVLSVGVLVAGLAVLAEASRLS
jgi:hypothetical protein